MTHRQQLSYAALLAALGALLCHCSASMSDSAPPVAPADAMPADHADASADAVAHAADGDPADADAGDRSAGEVDGDVLPGAGDAASCGGHCAAYAAAMPMGLVPPELVELSGLAASRRYPGRIYGHNDSGDSARMFALTQLEADGGVDVTELRLEGASADDWEDIAVGPCDPNSCVFVADIGDNKLSRSEYAIYRVREPETVTVNQAVTYERFAFAYPDGPHNAETLLVDPRSGRMFVVTKASDAQQVFEIPTPLDAGTIAIALPSQLVRHLPSSPITGGTFHPCADRVLLRTYGGLFEYQRSLAGALDTTFDDEPTSVPVAVELQGESVTYSADGLGYWTGSENVAAAPRGSLSAVRCQ